MDALEKSKNILKIVMLEKELKDIKGYLELNNPSMYAEWKKQWNEKL